MKHPVDGAKILLSTPGVSHLARIVAYEHHMLLDGSGYPNRPRGSRFTWPAGSSSLRTCMTRCGHTGRIARR